MVFLLIATPAVAAPESPEEFADWFIEQGFEGLEYYEWAAVFGALTDGINRNREPIMEIKDPVYVAIRTGTRYHNEYCTALKNASKVLTLDKVEATKRGFEACKNCKQ